MNADAIKRNWGVMIFVVILLALLGYIGWNLQGALARQAEATTRLEEQERQLGELQRSRPYPSTENLTALRQEGVQIADLYARLKTAAHRPVEVPRVDQIQFAQLLGSKRGELVEAARSNNVNVASDFAFGFDDYIGKLPPDNRHVIDTLTKHFLVIDRVSRRLYQSGVYGISAVGRQAIEIRAAGTPPRAAGTIYQRTPFEFKFTCNTEALRRFLNALAESDWLLVVRALEVEVKTVSFTVQADDDPAPVSPLGWPGTPGAMPGFTGRPGMAAPPPVFPTAPRTKTVERQQLEVTIKIDLVEFPATEADASAKPRAGAKS